MPAGPSSLGNRQGFGGPTIKPKSATPEAEVSPLVRPGGAAGSDRAPGRRLKEIGGAPRVPVNPSVHADPFAVWMDYFQKNDEAPGQVHETVRLLGANDKMRDVEAVLRGYLTKRPKNAEAWMYRALALAIHINHGSPAHIADALKYAAILARRTHNPNDLVSVADTMALLDHLDGQGALLDEAAAKIPHINVPLKMSVNLAQRQKDPVRMGDTVEKLLALGWPGEDEYIRTECRRQVDIMAKSLREDGREKEADGLQARLVQSEARDVYVRLTWDGYADFDLAVDEPLGVTASYELPRTVFGGSVLKNGFGKNPEEIYVCPRGFDGNYTVHIRQIWADETKPVVRLTLETIAHDGTPQEQKQVYTLTPDKINKTFVVYLSGGRRKTVLPYIDILAGRIEYQANRPVTAKHNRASRTPGPGTPGGGCDLRLMSSVKDVSAIPTEGKRLVIVAAVDHVLHFRIFDNDGKMVVDTDATQRTAQVPQIEGLRKQLEILWPPHELSTSEKGRVIDAVTSIVGHTPGGQSKAPASSKAPDKPKS
jgi:hypothetical protein